MNLQDVWQAAKRNDAEKHELNRKLQQVPGIIGCWQSHMATTAFSLWETGKGSLMMNCFGCPPIVALKFGIR